MAHLAGIGIFGLMLAEAVSRRYEVYVKNRRTTNAGYTDAELHTMAATVNDARVIDPQLLTTFVDDQRLPVDGVNAQCRGNTNAEIDTTVQRINDDPQEVTSYTSGRDLPVDVANVQYRGNTNAEIDTTVQRINDPQELTSSASSRDLSVGAANVQDRGTERTV